MATDTVGTKKTSPPRPEVAPESVRESWDNTLNMQRQWFSFWSRPFGNAPAPERMWQQWHDVNAEVLDFSGRLSDLTNSFVADQVKLARDFSSRTLGMTREPNQREPEDVTVELTREWLDATRRGTERAFSFGNDSIKALEDLGLQVAETLAEAPAKAR